MFTFLTILICALFLSIKSALATLDYSNFPICAQPILLEYTPPGCDFGSANTASNACFCADAVSWSTVAKAIHRTCGDSDLRNSAPTASSNRANAGTPLVLSVGHFIDQAGKTTTTSSSISTSFITSTTPRATDSSTTESSSATTTSAQAQSSNPSGGNGGHGYTEDQTIALGCGIGIPLATLFVTIWMCFCPC